MRRTTGAETSRSRVRECGTSQRGAASRTQVEASTGRRAAADRESDLDLLAVLHGPVDGAEEHDRLDDALWTLTLELGQVVSVLPISEEGAPRDTPLLRNIAREGIVVT